MPASRLRSHQANSEAGIVKARGGDSVSSVAARAGVPVEDLARINGLSTRSKLRKGQELLLPPSPKRQTSDNQRKVESYRIVLVDGSSIQVDEAWREKVGGPSPMEEDMLDFAFDIRPSSRLSCQIKVTEALDGLVVRIPDKQF